MATAYQIPITYVVNATAVTPSQGLEPLKLSTILILTDEEPAEELTGSYIISRNAQGVSTQWGTETEIAQQANIIFSQSPNILANDGYVIAAPYTSSSETTSEAITRLAGEIYFEGILTTRALADAEAEAAAQTVQAMNNRIMPIPSANLSALTAGTGLFSKIQSYTHAKPLLYTLGDDSDDQALNARLFAAAYLSRAFAVNYNGSNTTITMNLKDLVGIQADTNINETILAQAAAVGADCFVSLEGLAKVISNPQNGMYFDQITNQIWFVNTIQRNTFNVLATTRTKVPQTDAGLESIMKAIRNVCVQAVTNGMLAPGEWNSNDYFGTQEDFLRNIREFGYYIYHQPVAEQAQSEREQRKAPQFQVAAKEAGAVHSANILIYIEA